MTKNIGTARTKTKHILSVPKKLKGKLSISKFLQKFEKGDLVVFKASPGIQKGTYHKRFHGRTGRVVGSRKNAYEVIVNDLGKKKMVIVPSVHLVKVKNGTKNN